jgi:hypothetical protein
MDLDDLWEDLYCKITANIARISRGIKTPPVIETWFRRPKVLKIRRNYTMPFYARANTSKHLNVVTLTPKAEPE